MGEHIPTIEDEGFLISCAHCERERQSRKYKYTTGKWESISPLFWMMDIKKIVHIVRGNVKVKI
jgi:hypothetical protein